MNVTDLELPGLKLVEPKVFGDARGLFLAAADDGPSRDPVLTLTTKTEGPIYLCVSSSHDLGGPWHSYLMTIEEVK